MNRRPPPLAQASSRRFPAVTIVPGSPCCASSRGMQGRMMLAAEAPQLPLPDCSTPDQCRCRFSKHADRRQGTEDRRFPYADQRASWYHGMEKRGARGRRKDD